MLSRHWSVLALVAVAGTARADVTLHPLFTANMVLQQGVKLPVWGKAAPGEEVTVALFDGKTSTGTGTAKADDKGDWKVTLDAQKPGTGYRFEVAGKNAVALTNVAVGEVWVCSGQSNMEWPLNASYDADKAKAGALNANLRLFTVDKKTSPTPLTEYADLKHFSGWASSRPDNVGGFSAVAFHFGQQLQKALGVPVGLIHTSWGGTPAEAWTSNAALEAVPELKYYADRSKGSAERFAKDKKPVGPGTPSSLYNAMIHPLLPFAVKGAIWYQGESNASKAYEYRTLFRTMIQDWRAKWGTDIAFHLVQLAPWHARDADGVSWAELRQAQTEATQKLKGVGMAVITDVGDLLDIHPRDKATVGNRLARAALAKTYEKNVIGSGPTFTASKIDGDKVTLTFENVGSGLVAKYQTLNGFTVCGEDKYFYPAKAVISGKDTVIVTCDKVLKPVAVRFGWKNFPVANVYNREGLPVVPFRTDDFPWTTMPPKK